MSRRQLPGKPAPAKPRQLGDCAPGDVAQTPCGHLFVGDQVKGGVLVRLYHPDERRYVSQPFGVSADIAVLSITPVPLAFPPRQAASTTRPADRRAMHPSIDHVLRLFAFVHLPPHLQELSRGFSELAHQVADQSSNAETTIALRKLLEAKDAAVRAVLVKEGG